MNIQQLEYILAVDTHRHFATAAGKSNVTQPTLSMMIRKLEEELGVRIFDRSKQPVEPTPEGREIILRARQIMADVTHLKEFAKGLKSDVSGEIRIAIIPTLAPYLLPLFLPSFVEQYPKLRVKISESCDARHHRGVEKWRHRYRIALHTAARSEACGTSRVLRRILCLTLRQTKELRRKKYLLPKDIDLSKLWLLEEGHCFSKPGL